MPGFGLPPYGKELYEVAVEILLDCASAGGSKCPSFGGGDVMLQGAASGNVAELADDPPN